MHSKRNLFIAFILLMFFFPLLGAYFFSPLCIFLSPVPQSFLFCPSFWISSVDHHFRETSHALCAEFNLHRVPSGFLCCKCNNYIKREVCITHLPFQSPSSLPRNPSPSLPGWLRRELLGHNQLNLRTAGARTASSGK